MFFVSWLEKTKLKAIRIASKLSTENPLPYLFVKSSDNLRRFETLSKRFL